MRNKFILKIIVYLYFFINAKGQDSFYISSGLSIIWGRDASIMWGMENSLMLL